MAPLSICKIDGCRNPVLNKKRGWCSMHYQRWQRNGSPHVSKINRQHNGRCGVEGCERPYAHSGYCAHHAVRLKRTGDPLVASVNPRHHCREKWLKAHVNYSGDDCLKWPFTVGDHGRGTATLNGQNMSAPRAMCLLAHGEPPTPKHHASHSCGKGHEGCMSPRHLRWKTQKDNEADKVTHGTLRRGRQINTNKLTEDQVREIRQRAKSEVQKALAKEYGISAAAINAIVKLRAWAWLS